jgi:hypothetical protein
MKRFFLLAVLIFLCKEAATSQYIGTGIFAPERNLLGGNLLGGRTIYDGSIEECIRSTNKLPAIQTLKRYYENTASFYQSVSTETSISGELQSDYTMSATLHATTKSAAGSKNRVSGYAYQAYSQVSIDYQDAKCVEEFNLDDALIQSFETLPSTIDNPEYKNSWIEYETFLQKFGSHVIVEVSRGSSLYMYTFAKESSSYSKNDFKINACINLVVPTEAGLSNASICSGVTKEDIEKVSHLEMTSQFVARGGSDETRAKLSDPTQRNDTLIAKFLSEANVTDQPISYRLASIWTILQTKYVQSKENLARALNLAAYYKGYRSYGCKYQENDAFVFQKFVSTTHSSLPSYACQLAPQGCHQDDDCSYNVGIYCQCGGQTCVRYDTDVLDTDKEKPYAYAYTGSGWGGQGCTYSFGGCYCSEPSGQWRTVWSSSDDFLSFALMMHEKVNSMQKRLELESAKTKDEL